MTDLAAKAPVPIRVAVKDGFQRRGLRVSLLALGDSIPAVREYPVMAAKHRPTVRCGRPLNYAFQSSGLKLPCALYCCPPAPYTGRDPIRAFSIVITPPRRTLKLFRPARAFVAVAG